MEWEKLRLFHIVAESGSFTEAAKRIGGSQSALSRQIQALEQELGAALFHRHARGLALTAEGEELRETARDVTERIDHAERAIQASRAKPSGELRVTSTVSFGSTWLVSHLDEFCTLYPDIRLSLLLSDEEFDLSKRQADVAVRFHMPRQSDLIQRPLATVRQLICASPAYLERFGRPERTTDLDRHRLIAYCAAAPEPLRVANWILTIGANRPRQPLLSVNNVFAVLQAVEAGIGIAALPTYLIRFSGQVTPILPQAEGPKLQSFFVYPAELRRSIRVTVLRDYLVARMTDEALAI
jgi:DNA-binding transcriptional LysR family regulator